MAARPISAHGDRHSASIYSQSNEFPEIARFKVFIIKYFNIYLFIYLYYFRMKILFYFNLILLLEQHEIMKVQ